MSLKLNKSDNSNNEIKQGGIIIPTPAGDDEEDLYPDEKTADEDLHIEDLLKDDNINKSDEPVKLSKKDIQKFGIKKKHPFLMLFLIIFWILIFIWFNPIHNDTLDYCKNFAINKSKEYLGISYIDNVKKLDQNSFIETTNKRFPDGNTCEYILNVTDTKNKYVLVFETSSKNVGKDDILYTNIKSFFTQFEFMNNGKEVHINQTYLYDMDSFDDYLMDYGNDEAFAVIFDGFPERGAYSLELGVMYNSFVSFYLDDSYFTIKEFSYFDPEQD